jgi:hypothetical protein
LPTILQGRSLEDYRRIIKARQGKINDELGKIPIRIDEANRGLPEEPQLSKAQIEKDILTLREH